MDAKHKENARAAQMQSSCMAACRAVLAKHLKMVLAHMVEMMTQGQMQQGQQAWGQGKGRQIRHGKCGPGGVAQTGRHM